MTSLLLNRPSPEDDTVPSPFLVDRLRSLTALSKSDLINEAQRIARYELDQPSDLRRFKILERLRACLALRPDEAWRLAAAFKAAYRSLDIEERLELIDMERDAVLHGFKVEEASRIAPLIPWLGDCAPASLSARNGSSLAVSFMAAALNLKQACGQLAENEAGYER